MRNVKIDEKTQKMLTVERRKPNVRNRTQGDLDFRQKKHSWVVLVINFFIKRSGIVSQVGSFGFQIVREPNVLIWISEICRNLNCL